MCSENNWNATRLLLTLKMQYLRDFLHSGLLVGIYYMPGKF